MDLAQARGLTRLDDADAAWQTRGQGPRFRAVLEAGHALRQRLLRDTAVVCVRTFPLTTLAYPLRHAYWASATLPFPFVRLVHRALLVQFRQDGRVRTLLFNPTDVSAARRTPYFQRMIARYGVASELLASAFDPLEHQLAALGLTCADVDYVAFDHFHTQDLRGLLGTTDGRLAPRFPNAWLLAPATEWEAWKDLHPMQRAWFVPDGRDGVLEDRVRFLDGDVRLGDGVLLVRTPGHTSGNQTLFFRTAEGIWGCSENGVSADNWSPHASRIPGLAAHARVADVDFILNANTPERGADQYTSMALERSIVDPAHGDPRFVRMFPSSEAATSFFAPGFRPTWVHEQVHAGTPVPVPSRASGPR